MTEIVCIVGDGAWATVCANMLAQNGHRVRLLSIFPEHAAEMARDRRNRRFLPDVRLEDGVEVVTDPAAALADATLAMQMAPTQYIRTWWAKLAPHVRRDLPICSCAKGIEADTLLRPSQVVQGVLGDQPGAPRPIAVLSGPSIAPQIARGQPATVTIASADAALAARVQAAITRPYFRVYTHDDVAGVELAGATKNVIAVAAGVLDGLGAGDNAKAALITRGLAEITRLGAAMGARAQTFAGLSGLGDLVTTCISPIGRNRSFGEAVGRGESAQAVLARMAPAVVEGVATTRAVVELARRHGVDMPITSAVHQVLFAGQSPAQAIADLMSRPPKAE